MATTATCATTERGRIALAALTLLALAACEGDTGPPGPQGPMGGGPGPDPEPTELTLDDVPPDVNVEIVSLSGASGPAGEFEPGDTLSVRFTLTKQDGSTWPIQELTRGSVLVSGPTFGYQRVLPRVSNVVGQAVQNADDSYTYTFSDPIPDAYAAPYNDTPAFGPDNGERTGEPLEDGTYTVGLFFEWSYTLEGASDLRSGEDLENFLLGTGAGPLTPREVSQTANCNQCHAELSFHRGRYKSLTSCLVCHTYGAEDLNDPDLAGGTPGVTINSRVLFHKIHMGRKLPSVIGIGLNPDGSRDYGAPSTPYQVAGKGGVHDYSEIGFPVWPARTIPRAKNLGWSALTPAEQVKELETLTAVSECAACHGDPDGTGPLEAPAQGDLIFAQLTRDACGACHDDVDWEQNYLGSLGYMPPQPTDGDCIFCHESTFGGPLAVTDGHRHPLRDPLFNPGLNLDLVAVAEAGVHDGSGTFEPGEGVRVEFTLTDDAGADLDAATSLTALRTVLSGPTWNQQLAVSEVLPLELLSGPQPYSIELHERRLLERVGASTGVLGNVFATLAAPHADVASSPTVVRVTSGVGSAIGGLVQSAPAGQNFVDLGDASAFDPGDTVVVAPGAGAEEYLIVQHTEGERLWFSSPATPELPVGLRSDHPAGTVVRDVFLSELTRDVDYALDPLTGQVTELVEFGAGIAVLVDYVAPLALPSTYPTPLHGSPDLGEADGEWSGKPLVEGTYRLGLLAHREAVFAENGETNDYRIAAEPAVTELLVGVASQPEPYDLIDSGAACNACHRDLQFHGGRDRGFDSCLLCHGAAGSEDLATYVAPGAPSTPGTTVSFRTLLHRIHRGNELAQPHAVVSQTGSPPPDDWASNDYSQVFFPAQPGGTRDCARCHGDTNAAWLEPTPLEHPTASLADAQAWRLACVGCHDAPAAIAHIETQTAPSGAESCAICHGPGEELAVERVHTFF